MVPAGTGLILISVTVDIDNTYTIYVKDACLTNAEIKVVMKAARISEQQKIEAKAAQANGTETKKPKDGGRKDNDLQCDSQEREDSNNGRRATGGI